MHALSLFWARVVPMPIHILNPCYAFSGLAASNQQHQDVSGHTPQTHARQATGKTKPVCAHIMWGAKIHTNE